MIWEPIEIYKNLTESDDLGNPAITGTELICSTKCRKFPFSPEEYAAYNGRITKSAERAFVPGTFLGGETTESILACFGGAGISAKISGRNYYVLELLQYGRGIYFTIDAVKV